MLVESNILKITRPRKISILFSPKLTCDVILRLGRDLARKIAVIVVLLHVLGHVVQDGVLQRREDVVGVDPAVGVHGVRERDVDRVSVTAVRALVPVAVVVPGAVLVAAVAVDASLPRAAAFLVVSVAAVGRPRVVDSVLGISAVAASVVPVVVVALPPVAAPVVPISAAAFPRIVVSVVSAVAIG